MNCHNCKGKGAVRGKGRTVVICHDCKGTGAVVRILPSSMSAQIIGHNDATWQGKKVYDIGNTLPYINTRKKQRACRITGFEVQTSFMQQTHNYPTHYYPLKDVLFTGVDTVTGAEVCRPLWRSIPLKKKNELFETCIAERR